MIPETEKSMSRGNRTPPSSQNHPNRVSPPQPTRSLDEPFSEVRRLNASSSDPNHFKILKSAASKMASAKWARIAAISLLLSLGMSAAQRSLLMSGAKGKEAGHEPMDFDLQGGIEGTSGSSSDGGSTAMASSDMGSFGQDMPGEARAGHRDLRMDNGWDMDPDDKDSGDQALDAHDNPGVYEEPATIPRFPNDPYDPYSPPLSQWQGRFMYCSPMSCQGRTGDYGPGAGGDCAGFNMLIEYPPPLPPPVDQPGVNRNPVYSPNGAGHHGHMDAFGKPVAFPPASHATEMSDIPGGTWEEPTMPGQ